MKSQLETEYKEKIIPALKEKFGYSNNYQVPKLSKVVINMGVGAAVQEPKHLEVAIEELSLIAGQKAVPTSAKKAEAGFKIRAGMKIGCKVTLRRNAMYLFYEKLVRVAIPRIKDFRGVPVKSFDKQGNYSMGLKEQTLFPEIDPNRVKRVQGMNITFHVTGSSSKEETMALLSLMGMPFRK